MSPRIDIEEATLRYGKVTAVDNLSVTLDGPGIYGLLGRNGAGKTSLLAMLAAFRRPTSGEVLIDGEPVFENPSATGQICLIRETADTVEFDWPDNRVRNALSFAAANRPRWDSVLADRLVERFRLPLKKSIASLSKGQRGALAVTLGLATRAPITMFDESYLGMDAPSRYVFYDELLADHIEHPRLTIVSTHLIEEVSRLLEDVVIIDEGRLLLHENKDALEGRGATVIGPESEVDRFADGLTVLGERSLGSTKSLALYGETDSEWASTARQVGLEVGPLPLQDLFVHLTGRNSDSR